MHPDLYPYQVEGAYWLADNEHPNLLLGDEMGVGKTPTSIAGADLIGAKNVLVICPGIARANWQREFGRWQTMNRTIGVMYGSKDNLSTDVVVTSYSLVTTKKAFAKLMARSWDLMILDEAHALKNKDSSRAKRVYHDYLKPVNGKGLKSKAARVWLLTGTPIPNDLSEMWTHTRALFPEAIKGLERYRMWVDMFCTTRDTDFGTTIVGSKNTAEFVRRIKPYTLRRTIAQVLPQMPSLRVETVLVEPDTLPPRSAEIIELEKVVSAALAASAGGRTEAAQEAMRAAKEIHISSLRMWTGLAKAPAVAQQICTDFENGLDKTVLFAVHRETIKILHAGIPGSAVIDGRTSEKEANRLIDIFQGRVTPTLNASPLVCLIIQLDKGNAALTLTAACHVSFCETNWVPKDLIQAIGRVRRIGQTRPVLARIFSLKGSVDAQISATLARKTREISVIDNALAA